MTRIWTRGLAATGLGLAATLLAAVAGCGGAGERTDDATVVPQPGTTVAATATTGAPAAGGNTAAPAAPEKSTGTTTEAAPVKAEGFGTLKGQVVFDGDAPQQKELRAKGKAEKDPEYCATKGAIPDQRLVVDPGSKGVKWALVYIPRPTAVNKEAESNARQKTFEFDQKNCIFEPHVLGMTKGAKLLVKSSDGVGHNVDSKVENYGSLNTAVQPNQSLPPIDLKFPTTRPGEVVCDIHPWMKAWWMVVNSPYIAVTDEKGNFELKNVPAGTQKVVVWQEAVAPKFVTASSGEAVTIKANEDNTHVFHIKPEQVTNY
jgi:hypothetical protein